MRFYVLQEIMMTRAFHLSRRFATRVASVTLFVLTGCTTSFPKNRGEVVSNLQNSDYEKQAFELSMAALKGFRGDIHYVGSDARFDYFRVEKEHGFFRIVRRGTTLSGHRRFEVGAEVPFCVGLEVIPYPPAKTTEAEQAAP